MFYEYLTLDDQHALLYDSQQHQVARLLGRSRFIAQILHNRGFLLLVVLAAFSLLPQLPLWVSTLIVLLGYISSSYYYLRQFLPSCHWDTVHEKLPFYPVLASRFQLKQIRLNALIFGLMAIIVCISLWWRFGIVEIMLGVLLALETVHLTQLYRNVLRHPFVLHEHTQRKVALKSNRSK